MDVYNAVTCSPKGIPTTPFADSVNYYSFEIAGLGFSADYCMKQRVSDIEEYGRAIRITRYKCGRIQCPNCYQKWITETTFKYAVQLELYSLYTGERPSFISGSIHPDYYNMNSLSWKDYGNSFRRIYRRLKDLGVYAGLRVFHPFRIKRECIQDFKELGYGSNSGQGFWKGVRDNALEYDNYRDYLNLSPHLHCIVFPGWLQDNYDSDIIASKYGYAETTDDLVAHLKYLLSHTATSNDFDMDACMCFGQLFNFKPERIFKPKVICQVKQRVASVMGLGYDIDEDKLLFADDDKDDKYNWIPISKFLVYSAETEEHTEAFLSSIQDKVNRDFITYILELYNFRLSDNATLDCDKNVFYEDLPTPPPFLDVVFVDYKR